MIDINTYNELVKHEDTIIDIMLTSTKLSNSAVREGRPFCLKLTPYPRNTIGGRLYIALPRDTKCADIPGVPIVPLQGVKDKTGNFL